ncbi:GntR family transcriptional regulator [uncultured Paracoccus sp.]|uniref:GntR family transcriptional regulator n=1 Tax=uncultured Paracoccus sp. TaxID=189685 RepID=UPI00260DB4B8|nr:GntR family transcriptional regulator [uncultured Paracoccus sp.]
MTANERERVRTAIFAGGTETSRRHTTWQSVMNEVLHRIRTERYGVGELIPTEQQLAAELGCARATVNRALTELAARGILIRRRKVGTRVAENIYTAPGPDLDHLMRHHIERAGGVYGYRLLESGWVSPPDAIARALLLDRDETVLESKAMMYSDDLPTCHERRWTRQPVAQQLTQEVLETIGANEWLVGNVNLDRIETVVDATTAGDAGCAEYMGADAASPVLSFLTCAWMGMRPVTYVQHTLTPGRRVPISP